MTTIMDVVPLLVGTPTNEFQTNVLYMVASMLTVIGVMFFYKLFLLIGGYLSPNNR